MNPILEVAHAINILSLIVALGIGLTCIAIMGRRN
jgi:hypothetical protein